MAYVSGGSHSAAARRRRRKTAASTLASESVSPLGELTVDAGHVHLGRRPQCRPTGPGEQLDDDAAPVLGVGLRRSTSPAVSSRSTLRESPGCEISSLLEQISMPQCATGFGQLDQDVIGTERTSARPRPDLSPSLLQDPARGRAGIPPTRPFDPPRSSLDRSSAPLHHVEPIPTTGGGHAGGGAGCSASRHHGAGPVREVDLRGTGRPARGAPGWVGGTVFQQVQTGVTVLAVRSYWIESSSRCD